MYLTEDEVRLVLKAIKTIETTQGFLSPEMVELRDKIKYEYGL